MKFYHILSLLVLPIFLFSCQNAAFIDKYSSDSAFAILEIGEDIRSGKVIEEGTWEQVFDTEGYRKYLSTSRKDFLCEMIIEAKELAFSPDRMDAIDSVLLRTPDANDCRRLCSRIFASRPKGRMRLGYSWKRLIFRHSYPTQIDL